MTLAAEPILEVTAFGVAAGSVIGLLALGLVLIYRTTGVMNFAHWAIGILAIVLYAFLTGIGLPPLLAIPFCILLSIAAGIAAYRFIFKRVDRSNQIIVILISVGVAQLYASSAAFFNGFQTFTRLPAWLPVAEFNVGSAVLKTTELYTVIIAIGVAFGFLVWFRASRTGKALRAVAQNREAAILAGIDDVKYNSIAWAIGSGLAAISLLMVMPHSAGDQGLITTVDLTPLGTLLIAAFGAALVGGLVNLPMALLGGMVFGVSTQLLVLAPAPWNELRTALAGVLIVVLLLLRTERFFATQQELEALET